MFYYYGRKGNSAKTYPPPDYPIVIEPFGGSMGYTMHHRPRFAIGIDADPTVVDLWHRLTTMSIDDIDNHPGPILGQATHDFWHIVAAASDGNLNTTYRTATTELVKRFERQRRLALRHHLYASRSVIYRHGDYTVAPDIEGTWFIDPPYLHSTGYRHRPDVESLARWVRTRRGQVIVCEGEGADWLRFVEHARPPSIGNTHRAELIWTANTSLTCARCGDRFNGRTDARWCSTRCRVAAHRAKPKPVTGHGQPSTE